MGRAKKISQQGIIRELQKIGFAEMGAENVKPTDKMKALEMMVKLLGIDEPEQKVLEKLDELLGQIDDQ